MDAQAEVRDFLTACRGRLSPTEAGFPTYGGVRRVPGLRREEVAYLAGVSVDYYTRLERGRVAGVSDEVLDSVARALRLDDVEREHLFHLVRALRGMGAPKRGQSAVPDVRPEIRRVMKAIKLPAYLHNARLDVLDANELGRAIFPPAGKPDGRPFNHVRFQFLDPRARTFYRDYSESDDPNRCRTRRTSAACWWFIGSHASA